MATSLGVLLVNAIASLVGGRLEPGEAQEGLDKPYATYAYDGEDEAYLSGRSHLVNRTVELDLYDVTHEAVDTLKSQVIAAMTAQSCYASPSSFTATVIHETYVGRDPRTKTHRYLLHFSVWYYR